LEDGLNEGSEVAISAPTLGEKGVVEANGVDPERAQPGGDEAARVDWKNGMGGATPFGGCY